VGSIFPQHLLIKALIMTMSILKMNTIGTNVTLINIFVH